VKLLRRTSPRTADHEGHRPILGAWQSVGAKKRRDGAEPPLWGVPARRAASPLSDDRQRGPVPVYLNLTQVGNGHGRFANALIHCFLGRELRPPVCRHPGCGPWQSCDFLLRRKNLAQVTGPREPPASEFPGPWSMANDIANPTRKRGAQSMGPVQPRPAR